MDFLARAVARFAGTGLSKGDGVIVIATVRHWRTVRQRLEHDGFDLDSLQSTRRSSR